MSNPAVNAAVAETMTATGATTGFSARVGLRPLHDDRDFRPMAEHQGLSGA